MNTKWTYDKLQKEALRFKNKGAFYEKSGSAYAIALRRKILDQICSHMENRLIHWTINSAKKEALKYKTRGEFAINSPNAYNWSRKNGSLEQICSHMKAMYIYWTNEMLQEKALLYKTRSAFEKSDFHAYTTSLNRGVMDEICSHMANLYIYWTSDSLLLEALKYSTRTEFARKSSSAYNIALSRNILNEICKHMKLIKGGPSIAERELFMLIKSFHPTTKKTRDRKVNIVGKPYIKGFEIDIFIPELNRGIEFDGKYHHSFKYMRADNRKNLWSDDDIRNYHEIKDSWFASKGIQVLHIREEDWIKDKEACIKHCFEFLSSVWNP